MRSPGASVGVPKPTHPGRHELQLRHDRRVDQVPVHHQADLHGVGGEGQQVRESTDCKVTGASAPSPLGPWGRRDCLTPVLTSLLTPLAPIPLRASRLPAQGMSPDSKRGFTPPSTASP